MISALILSGVALSAADQHRQSEASLAETRSMVHRYGKCVLKKQQKRASAAIRANIGRLRRGEEHRFGSKKAAPPAPDVAWEKPPAPGPRPDAEGSPRA